MRRGGTNPRGWRRWTRTCCCRRHSSCSSSAKCSTSSGKSTAALWPGSSVPGICVRSSHEVISRQRIWVLCIGSVQQGRWGWCLRGTGYHTRKVAGRHPASKWGGGSGGIVYCFLARTGDIVYCFLLNRRHCLSGCFGLSCVFLATREGI